MITREGWREGSVKEVKDGSLGVSVMKARHEYTKFEIGISLNPFNFFQGKTHSEGSEGSVKDKNGSTFTRNMQIISMINGA